MKNWKANHTTIADERGIIAQAYQNTRERYIGTIEAEANAKLMAAAPEMLDALNGVIKLYAGLDFMVDGETQEMIKKVCSAIKKATN